MKKTPLKRKTPLKAYTRLVAKTPLKTYSKKRAKAEKERYSIFTSDLKHCIEDKDHLGEIDRHEIFNGKNRLKSMKYGLVVPLCRNCHSNDEIVVKWQVIGRKAFIKEHGEELFIKEFQTKKGRCENDKKNIIEVSN
jgi:hypothetical protein